VSEHPVFIRRLFTGHTPPHARHRAVVSGPPSLRRRAFRCERASRHVEAHQTRPSSDPPRTHTKVTLKGASAPHLSALPSAVPYETGHGGRWHAHLDRRHRAVTGYAAHACPRRASRRRGGDLWSR
jgi:hypothetical protein